MAYAPHIRCQASGVFLGTTEQWSFTVNMAGIDPGVLSSLLLSPNDTVWEDLADDFASFVSSAPMINNKTQLRSVKFASIAPDGKYAASPIIKERIVVGGGGANFTFPTQIALAATLKTGSPLGKVKGRFYIPGYTGFLGLDARITLADATTARDLVDTFLTNLGNQPGVDVLDLRPVVASTKGQNWPVTGVSVGRVLDTIRSRRSSLVEAYTADTDVS